MANQSQPWYGVGLHTGLFPFKCICGARNSKGYDCWIEGIVSQIESEWCIRGISRSALAFVLIICDFLRRDMGDWW